MQGDFFLTQGVFLGMRWLFETLTGQSIVLTVVISTIIIRALSLIGDIKSRESSLKMSAIQPQLDKLRKKFENDPQRLQREQSKLMKENGVSMFGGCLPMLFTLPLFFIFIAAFRQWGSEMMVHLIVTLDDDPEAGVEMFKSFKFLWVNNMWQPDSGFASVINDAQTFLMDTKLPRLFYFRDHPEAMQKFLDLGFFVKDSSSKYGVAVAQLTDEITATYNSIVQPCIDLYAGYNNGWFVLPVVCGGSQFLASWITTKSQPQQDSSQGSMKLLMYLMPLITVFYCLRTNSAFALYWTVSSVLSLLTTWLINKSFERKNKVSIKEG